mgnify:CR=1
MRVLSSTRFSVVLARARPIVLRSIQEESPSERRVVSSSFGRAKSGDSEYVANLTLVRL